jgi:hypothetical protein
MANREQASKGQYTKPSLTDLGDIKEMTQGGGNSYSENVDMYTPPPPGNGCSEQIKLPPRGTR